MLSVASRRVELHSKNLELNYRIQKWNNVQRRILQKENKKEESIQPTLFILWSTQVLT